MKQIKIALYSLLASTLLFTIGCKDDDDPTAVQVSTITAVGTDLTTGQATTKDLNGSTSATEVPLDAVITIIFDKAVDHESVEPALSLRQGSTDVPFTHTQAGNTIVLTPTDDLEKGTDYTLAIAATLKGEDGSSFAAVSRSFKTAGRADVTPPQDANQVAYFGLDSDPSSSVGNLTGTETAIEYCEDRLGVLTGAACFDGDASLIEATNGSDLITPSMSISYWVYVDSTNHRNANNGTTSHFVMGVGNLFGQFIEIAGDLGWTKWTTRYAYTTTSGTQATAVSDFFFNADGMSASAGGWEAIEYEADIDLGSKLQKQWAHFVWTYDAATRTRSLYLNGVLMETDNFNNITDVNSPLKSTTGLSFSLASEQGAETIGTDLALGFMNDKQTTHWSTEPWGSYALPTANHLKGALDDVRFWNVALTQAEAEQLYNAEKP